MAQTVATGTILDKILAQTAEDLARRKAQRPIEELERQVGDRLAPVSLALGACRPRRVDHRRDQAGFPLARRVPGSG